MIAFIFVQSGGVDDLVFFSFTQNVKTKKRKLVLLSYAHLTFSILIFSFLRDKMSYFSWHR